MSARSRLNRISIDPQDDLEEDDYEHLQSVAECEEAAEEAYHEQMAEND